MLFNSFEFLIFFPIVVVCYYVLPHRFRSYGLLLASYYFYFAWEPSLVFLLLTSTIVDYYCGIKIDEAVTQSLKKLYLWTSICINLGLLFYFKYLIFFTQTTSKLLSFFGVEYATDTALESYNISLILLPVGISFYTFQTMSYSIDIYRGDIKAERDFTKYALYVSFFPQLVAGPIERAGRLLPQFYKKITINTDRIKKGIIMMAWGFFLKLVVADRLGIYVDTVFSSPSFYKGFPLILGSIFFAFQLYFDFSAYTTIAIGAANVMGFDLMQNFNRPFFSKSLGELWQRWHISLLNWLRDYIYKPLAKKNLRIYWIVMIVFFINGLWHGAHWNFVIWGLLNGVFLVFELATKKWRVRTISRLNLPIPRKFWHFLWWVVCFTFLPLSLIFFRSPTFDIALEYFANIFRFEEFKVDVYDNKLELTLSIILLLLVQVVHYFKGNAKVYELVTHRPVAIRWAIYIAFIATLLLLAINRQNNFIYFQF